MFEEDLDSSLNEYIEITKPAFDQSQWDMAIGLQEVDNLKPSKYLLGLVKDNLDGKLSLEEIINKLKAFYKKNKLNHDEFECDFVSTRIVEF